VSRSTHPACKNILAARQNTAVVNVTIPTKEYVKIQIFERILRQSTKYWESAEARSQQSEKRISYHKNLSDVLFCGILKYAVKEV